VRASGELAAFVERVRGATQALSDLTGAASAVGPDLVEAIRTTLDEVERRLDDKETVVALAGEPAARRTLLNAIVGARAFDPAARPPPGAMVILRPDRAFDYTATLRGGPVVEFGWRMPAREESFAKAQQRAEADREAAETAERELRDRLETVRRAAASTSKAPAGDHSVVATQRLPTRRFWRWVWRVVRRVSAMLGRKRLASASPGTATGADPELEMASLEQSVREARTRLQQAEARMEALRKERPKYDQERAEAFVQDVRALTDATARGKEVISLSIACPTTQLPAGFALLDAAEPSDLIHGVVLATADGEPDPEVVAALERLHRPARTHVVRKPAELGAALERIRAERSVVAATRAAASLRACIVRVAEEGARAQAECKRRILALEGQRIPDPADFRAGQMQRVSRAVEDGARDVQKVALARWAAAIADTRAEWHASVNGCSSREQMSAFVRTLNETVRARVEAMVDDVSQHAVLELQKVSESIQMWLLEEIRGRYHVMRRIEHEEEAAAVVGGEIAIAPLHRPPLASALDKFEARRVNLGLGGVAAGAAIGTLIVPGIGTAVGAFVGVFAGLLEGLDSLKRQCIGRLDKCLDEVEASVAAQISGREAFGEELRASLDQALDNALAQLDSSISRLMALERRVLEDERKRGEELARLRTMLEEHVVRIASSIPPRGAS
jgi:hypothetical protein